MRRPKADSGALRPRATELLREWYAVSRQKLLCSDGMVKSGAMNMLGRIHHPRAAGESVHVLDATSFRPVPRNS